MKKSMINFIETKSIGYTRHDGSLWALCAAVAVRLPSWFTVSNVKEMSDKFIQNMIDYDQKDEYTHITEFVPNTTALKSRKNVILTISDVFGVKAEYIRLFDWNTDVYFKVNLSTGLIYVYETVLNVLIGLILPVKIMKKEAVPNGSL